VFPLGQPDVVRGRQYTTVSQSLGAEEVSLWGRSELVSLRQCVRESSSVSVRNKKSTVLKVNYRRRKPAFRRVAAVSGVRSLSLY
jgi:hypothetical protein